MTHSPLTVILSETRVPLSLEMQIAAIIDDLTGRSFRPEIIEVPGDRDGYVYIGSDYYGTIRRTAMSDRFRYTIPQSYPRLNRRR